MLKIERLLVCIMVSFLVASCCFNKADRELLNQASIDAKEAKLLAKDAVKDANEAVQKSEIIFKQSQKK
jgi:hypothetical protein